MDVASQTDGSVAKKVAKLKTWLPVPSRLMVIFLHFMVNSGDEAQQIRSWELGEPTDPSDFAVKTHWSDFDL